MMPRLLKPCFCKNGISLTDLSNDLEMMTQFVQRELKIYAPAKSILKPPEVGRLPLGAVCNPASVKLCKNILED